MSLPSEIFSVRVEKKIDSSMKSLMVFVSIFSRLAIFRLTRIATRDTTFMVAKWSVELELTLKSYSSGEQLLD